MATKHAEPDVDAWRELEQRQRRVARNRKVGALAVAAVVLLVAGIIAVRAIAHRSSDRIPLTPSERPSDGVAIVDLEGTIVGTIGADGGKKAESLLQDVFAFGISLSPDGNRVAASNGSDIYMMNVDGTGLAKLTEGYDPSWSPNGSLIAFADVRGIHVISPDGTGHRTVVRAGGGIAGFPAWSPDGERIAYNLLSTHAARDGTYVVDAYGGRPTRLTTNCCDMRPVWHPDGTTIVFQRSGWTEDLYTVAADGDARATRLVATDAGERSGLWSPSGDLLAYGMTSSQSGGELDVRQWDVHVLNMRTGEDRVVLEGALPIAWASEQALVVGL